jgi:hypothetical protein
LFSYKRYFYVNFYFIKKKIIVILKIFSAGGGSKEGWCWQRSEGGLWDLYSTPKNIKWSDQSHSTTLGGRAATIFLLCYF